MRPGAGGFHPCPQKGPPPPGPSTLPPTLCATARPGEMDVDDEDGGEGGPGAPLQPHPDDRLAAAGHSQPSNKKKPAK